jgi:hypothetical protein
VLRSAPDAGFSQALCGDSPTCGRNTHSDSRRLELRRSRGPFNRQRPTHGLHGGRPDGSPCCAHGANGDGGLDPPIGSKALRLAEGFVEVKPLGAVNVKGLSEPVEVFEVTGAGPARTRLQAGTRRGLTRFVGRDAELERLRLVQQRAGSSRGQVAAIVGEAGVGKSRLVYEFTHSHRLEGWLTFEAASVSYGKATSYLPVIDLLRSYFKIQDRDDVRDIRAKITGRLLTLDRALEQILTPLLALLDVAVDDPAWQPLDPAQRRHRTLDVVRALLLREAREQPLLVIFEDLHWVDSETQAVPHPVSWTLSKPQM